VSKRQPTRYSDEEVRRGMAAVALHSGNAQRASRALKSQGLPISRATLSRWVNTRPDEYAELRRDVIDKVHAVVAEKHSELADQEMELAREFLERMRQEKNKIEPRDLSTALRNLDVGSGIHADKAMALRDRLPGSSIPIRNFTDILNSLKERNIRFVIEAGPEQAPPEPAAIEGSAEELEQ
jgi:ASC-1-like (ASCH) protein